MTLYLACFSCIMMYWDSGSVCAFHAEVRTLRICNDMCRMLGLYFILMFDISLWAWFLWFMILYVMSCHYDTLCYVRLKLSGPDLVRLCPGIDEWSTDVDYVLWCRYYVMSYELSRKAEGVRPHLELSCELCITSYWVDGCL